MVTVHSYHAWAKPNGHYGGCRDAAVSSAFLTMMAVVEIELVEEGQPEQFELT
jgi:hypothetical protein